MNTMPVIPAVIAAGAGLTVIFVFAALRALRAPAHAARGRIAALAEPTSIYSNETPTVLRDRGVGRLAVLDRLLGGADDGGLQRTLDRSGLPLRVGEYVALRLLALAGGALLLMVILGALSGGGVAVPGAFLGLVTGLVVPPVIVRVATRRRSAAIETQLIELCDLMASMLRTGYGYTQALASTAAEIEDPLSGELLRLVDAVRLGGDVDEALEDLNRRLGSRDFDMIATAISVQRRSGGNLAEILDGVGETIRHRQAFRDEISALTARERFSAVVVAGLPLVLVAVLMLMDPGRYGLLFIDPRGQIIFGLAMIMNIVGFVVIKRVSKLEV